MRDGRRRHALRIIARSRRGGCLHVADLLLDIELDAAIVADARRNAEDDAGIAVGDRVDDRGIGDDGALRLLRRHRHLVADLQHRLLVVEHHQRRRGDQIDGRHRIQGVERDLDVGRIEKIGEASESRYHIRDLAARGDRRGAEGGGAAAVTVEEPFQPESQLVGQRDLGDGGLDHDLMTGNVDAREDLAHPLIFPRRRGDDQRIVRLVRNDADAGRAVAGPVDDFGLRLLLLAGRGLHDTRLLRRAANGGGLSEPRAAEIEAGRLRLGLERGREAVTLIVVVAQHRARPLRLRRDIGCGAFLLLGAVNPSQQHRQLDGRAVLHMIDVDLLFRRLTGEIDPAEPALGLAQIFGPGGDHQHRFQPRIRNEAHDALARAVAVISENRVELLGDGFGIAALDGQQREGHAFHPVEIEGIDRRLDRGELARRAGHDQEVARIIDALDLRLRRDRLQHPLHFDRRHIAQRHDRRSGAHLLPPTPRRPSGSAGCDRIGRHDLVDAVLDRNGDAFGAQDGFEDLQQLVFRHRLRRAQRDRGLDLVADAIVDVQNVAEDGLGDLGHARPDQIEGDAVLVDLGPRAAIRRHIAACHISGEIACTLIDTGRLRRRVGRIGKRDARPAVVVGERLVAGRGEDRAGEIELLRRQGAGTQQERHQADVQSAMRPQPQLSVTCQICFPNRSPRRFQPLPPRSITLGNPQRFGRIQITKSYIRTSSI